MCRICFREKANL
ncbi:MAG: hypothetical protein LBF15_01375 [Candidatus Peribacteria bacterium]|nr:hypothetical protein [Candidatus Peribacteria bacterium]